MTSDTALVLNHTPEELRRIIDDLKRDNDRLRRQIPAYAIRMPPTSVARANAQALTELCAFAGVSLVDLLGELLETKLTVPDVGNAVDVILERRKREGR